jgi:hypothetical protein
VINEKYIKEIERDIKELPFKLCLVNKFLKGYILNGINYNLLDIKNYLKGV